MMKKNNGYPFASPLLHYTVSFHNSTQSFFTVPFTLQNTNNNSRSSLRCERNYNGGRRSEDEARREKQKVEEGGAFVFYCF